jgi:hypothetical protein
MVKAMERIIKFVAKSKALSAYASIDEAISETNCIIIKIIYEFGEAGTYHDNFIITF